MSKPVKEEYSNSVSFNTTKRSIIPFYWERQFLLNNGFRLVEPNSYANDRVNIVFSKDEFTIADNDGQVYPPKVCCLFWLIGFLTFNKIIDKNYN